MLTNLTKFTLSALTILMTFAYAQPVVNEHSIKFESSTTATVVGEDGVILKTNDFGQSWVEQSSGITNVLYGYSVDNGVSVIAAENGVILRSDDGGDNWVVILPGTLSNLNDAEINSGNAVVCGDNGVIYYSNNAGVNWSMISTGVTANLYDIDFITSNLGFITGEMGTLLKTTNGGANWEQIDMSFTNDKFNAVSATDEYNLFVVGDLGSLFYSNDGGITWQGYNGPQYSNNFNDIVFYNSLNGIIAGDNGLILRTTDGGTTWEAANVAIMGLVSDLYSVAFANINSGIATGKDGLEVYSTDGGATWTETPPAGMMLSPYQNRKNNNEAIKSLQNYPNPFNPATKITYELSFDANVSLQVYDITGKLVSDLTSSFQKAGSYSVDFNASGLASGVYFYKLAAVSGSRQESKIMKMILTK